MNLNNPSAGDNFSLVSRASSAVEKAKPGARRVLSGMVADTLALAKNEPIRKLRSLRIVQVNDEPSVLEAFALIIRNWFPDATVLSFSNAVAALEELSQSNSDLVITDDAMPGMRGSELCQRLLDRKVAYPIIVNSPWEPTEQWVRELAGQGLNVFFLPVPCDLEDLRKILEVAGIEIPREATGFGETTPKLRKIDPFRIVVVDDEDWFTEFLELAILAKFKNVSLQTFQNSKKAWLELSRRNPDLLIVGGQMPELDGQEIVRRLVDRKVTYPIIVVSGWPLTERWVQTYTDSNPNITFLGKPFTAEQLQKKLSRHLSASDNSQPMFEDAER